MNIEQLEQTLRMLDSRMQEIENTRNPRSFEGKLNEATRQIDTLYDQLSKIATMLKSLQLEDRYVEAFRDSEIEEFYAHSGYTLHDVKKFVEKNITEGREMTLQGASLYTNGMIKDMKARSIIGKWLRNAAIQKTRTDIGPVSVS